MTRLITFLSTHKLNRFWFGYFYINFLSDASDTDKVYMLMKHRMKELGATQL